MAKRNARKPAHLKPTQTSSNARRDKSKHSARVSSVATTLSTTDSDSLATPTTPPSHFFCRDPVGTKSRPIQVVNHPSPECHPSRSDSPTHGEPSDIKEAHPALDTIQLLQARQQAVFNKWTADHAKMHKRRRRRQPSPTASPLPPMHEPIVIDLRDQSSARRSPCVTIKISEIGSFSSPEAITAMLYGWTEGSTPAEKLLLDMLTQVWNAQNNTTAHEAEDTSASRAGPPAEENMAMEDYAGHKEQSAMVLEQPASVLEEPADIVLPPTPRISTIPRPISTSVRSVRNHLFTNNRAHQSCTALPTSLRSPGSGLLPPSTHPRFSIPQRSSSFSTPGQRPREFLFTRPFKARFMITESLKKRASIASGVSTAGSKLFLANTSNSSIASGATAGSELSVASISDSPFSRSLEALGPGKSSIKANSLLFNAPKTQSSTSFATESKVQAALPPKGTNIWRARAPIPMFDGPHAYPVTETSEQASEVPSETQTRPAQSVRRFASLNCFAPDASVSIRDVGLDPAPIVHQSREPNKIERRKQRMPRSRSSEGNRVAHGPARQDRQVGVMTVVSFVLAPIKWVIANV